MITYQVEVVVPATLVDQWVQYMTSEHINDVLATGYFASARLVKLIDTISGDAAVFRVIYRAHSLEALNSYRRDSAPALQAHHTMMFGDAVKATRSVTVDVWPSD